jgi:hypothetical protein
VGFTICVPLEVCLARRSDVCTLIVACPKGKLGDIAAFMPILLVSYEVQNMRPVSPHRFLRFFQTCWGV